MRILVLQDYLRCGGTEHQSVFLAEYFARAGHEVSLLSFRPGGLLRRRLEGNRVGYRALQPFDLHLNFYAPGLFRDVARVDPDVILCMGKMANCYAGLLVRRFPDVSVAATVRSGRDLSPMERWSCRRAHVVLTNSDWWRGRLLRYDVDAARIHVVHNALVHPWQPKAREAVRRWVRRRMGISDETVVFLNVASFRPGKRHALLIELFSRLEPAGDWELWLVGDGREWRRCRKLAAGSPVAQRIRFLGYSEDPSEYYAGADVGVSTSVEDSLPNFVAEAQRAGLPVVAVEVRGVGEAMRAGKTGFLVAPHDSREFLERVRRLRADATLRRTMGKEAVRFARQRFAPERQTSRMLEILSALHHARGQTVEPATPTGREAEGIVLSQSTPIAPSKGEGAASSQEVFRR